MNKIKKIFGEINLTWSKVIIFAIISGVYTAVMAMVPIVKDTSFSDITVTFEVWIFCGIFIIMNSKSAKDSALKCFVFFLISQPLVYIIQDLIKHTNLFVTYYMYWFIWTIATIFMGFIGYYMKKDKWWGMLILVPILILLGLNMQTYISLVMFSFPRHILTVIFCLITIILYPLTIFNNIKIRIVGGIISSIIIIAMIIWSIINPPIYSTDILSNGEKYIFDDTYKVYLKNTEYGDLKIKYEKNTESWMVHANFKKAGKTEFVLESPNGEKKIFNIVINRNSYIVDEK